MFKEHYVFEKPDDENIKICRYLDFSKFVSLLEKKKLFFPNVDKLSKSDPFEGKIPRNFPRIPRDDIWIKNLEKIYA